MTDSQLIREIKDGNVQLYNELMRRYERKILAFIFHMLKNTQMEAIAEDLCNETFYKAYRSLHSFREIEASFSTWLYTIARNTVLSELRKNKSVQVSLEQSGLTPHASFDAMPEQAMLRNEKVSMVREAINSLPEKQRSALILREYDQMDYQEIANI
jgi:RNA polymerase sigma factor (sigma-70 family)